MYQLNYFQKDFTNIDCLSFKMYQELVMNNKIIQPIIFCDKYLVDPLVKVPILHSYFINQYFHKNYTLTDYDQLSYIEHFKINNFIIVYNPDVHETKSYENKYHFISMNDNINTYMEQFYDK